MSKIKWIWTDDDGRYKNYADEVSDIVVEILNYYYQFEDDEVSCLHENCKLYIHYDYDEELHEYEIDDDEDSIEEFLQDRAVENGRKDTFSIYLN